MKKEMRLNNAGLGDREAWAAAGYTLPSFDRSEMMRRTAETPKWVHFGAGNIFRAFQANVCQKLLDRGETDTGIIVAEGFDYEIIERMYRPHDDLSVLVTLKADGSTEKTIVGSMAESCILDTHREAEFGRLKEIFSNPSLQMASFTITEKGYSLSGANGDVFPAVAEDFENGPDRPESYIGKVAALLYARYRAGQYPIAMVSMDNCSHNGEKLFRAIHAYGVEWVENGRVEKGFLGYIEDPGKISFPWSMIDKITPRPDASVQAVLAADGLQDTEPVVTSRNTYTAPFVNAEESEYLVIEDRFPNGRPPLEKAGIIFTDRDTVNRVERMKVCTCLNPLHTALAVFGCLLGFQKISDEMKDPALRELIRRIGYQEGLPVVTDPGVLDPKKFIDTVVDIRIPNPYIPDTPQRIATDTSQKLAIRFGETIKAYLASDTLDIRELKLIPLVFAGWLRYLMGVDDDGRVFGLSPDPLLDEARPVVAAFHVGDSVSAEDAEKQLLPLLKNAGIFGVKLEKIGMAGPVSEYFTGMLAGRGAVRAVLEKCVR